MEYYCAIRKDESMDFYKNQKDLHKLMWSEMSRTRITLYTINGNYGMIKFAINLNSMILDSLVRREKEVLLGY